MSSLALRGSTAYYVLALWMSCVLYHQSPLSFHPSGEDVATQSTVLIITVAENLTMHAVDSQS